MKSSTADDQLQCVGHEARLANGFELLAHTGADGATVIEIYTNDGGALHHDAQTVPYVRVYVNEDLVHDHSPAEPLPGSDDAEEQRCEECRQQIPHRPAGETFNRHHDPTCSLHDARVE